MSSPTLQGGVGGSQQQHATVPAPSLAYHESIGMGAPPPPKFKFRISGGMPASSSDATATHLTSHESIGIPPPPKFHSRVSSGVPVSAYSYRTGYGGAHGQAAAAAAAAANAEDAESTSRYSSGRSHNTRNSFNTTALSFFRHLIKSHNQDYRSDAPQQPSSSNALVAGVVPQHATLPSEPLHPDDEAAIAAADLALQRRRSSLWNRLCCGVGSACCWPARQRHRLLLRILNHPVWKMHMIFFAFILLFGAQIRELFIPKQGDDACDIVFLLALCFFSVDIVMRMDAEPNYFRVKAWCLSCCDNNNSNNNSASSDNDMRSDMDDVELFNSGFCGSHLHFGSFLFWCDIISTLALVSEISFMYKAGFEEQEYFITLGAFGIPTSGLNSVNEASPVQIEVGLLVLICKTARVARFIRSSTAVKISSKVNWYFLVDLLNPITLFGYLCLGHARPGSSSHARSASISSKRNLTDGMPSGRGSATGTGSLATNNKDGCASAEVAGSVVKVSDMAERRLTWGFVSLTALAAVKQQRQHRHHHHSHPSRQAHHPDGGSGFEDPSYSHARSNSSNALMGSHTQGGGVRRIMRFFGVVASDNEEWRRHVAAIKIQRAWRGARGHRHIDDEGYESFREDVDVAWKGRSSAVGNAMERTLKQRSMMHHRNQSRLRNVYSGMEDGTLGATATPAMGVLHSRASQTVLGEQAKRRNESQVGSAMRELTGQRVAIGILISLVVTVLFTYTENDATRSSTMIVLHTQTANPNFAERALIAARGSSVPDLFSYTLANGEVLTFPLPSEDPTDLRPRETLRITVYGATEGSTTEGLFAYRNEEREAALVSLLTTIFILLVWFFGVTAFAGPVMILVVIPIERMVRLLEMLMVDPLGYQSTRRYKKFVAEEDEVTKNTRWTKEVLKGMETSFLMSTILRIGSLMKVGFGSAGVEIIRQNLEKGQSKNTFMLNSQGSTVSCIFLFCDIRQFTDATECLQEEVFVFTNRIAAVVHSICHSYGGSANKNVGDAFLLSWLLDEDTAPRPFPLRSGESFTAKSNQADKALLSVVKICTSLHYDNYYLEPMTDTARDALLAKLSKRKGPVVQMGFGMHAGKAVQGAIGSHRKIDATYVSEAVERAEFLESSTKKYKLNMLMSDSFHRLLHPGNRRRCRKVDQILIRNEDDESDEQEYLSGDVMELFTFDMDIDALWNVKKGGNRSSKSDTGRESDSEIGSEKGSKREVHRKGTRRLSMRIGKDPSSDEISENLTPQGPNQADVNEGDGKQPQLVLPSGPALYNTNVWISEDMRKMRQLYSDGLFFQKFNSGLQAFYAKDWEHAKQCFSTILERFEDGPSRYFYSQIEKYKGKPPKNFLCYGTA